MYVYQKKKERKNIKRHYTSFDKVKIMIISLVMMKSENSSLLSL